MHVTLQHIARVPDAETRQKPPLVRALLQWSNLGNRKRHLQARRSSLEILCVRGWYLGRREGWRGQHGREHKEGSPMGCSRPGSCWHWGQRHQKEKGWKPHGKGRGPVQQPTRQKQCPVLRHRLDTPYTQSQTRIMAEVWSGALKCRLSCPHHHVQRHWPTCCSQPARSSVLPSAIASTHAYTHSLTMVVVNMWPGAYPFKGPTLPCPKSLPSSCSQPARGSVPSSAIA